MRTRTLLILLILFGSWANARNTTPYSDAEIRSIETDREAQIREIREQEITQLKITLGRRQPESRRADLYMRLAETYFEGYRAAYLQEGRVNEKRIAQGRNEMQIDRSHSRPFLNWGIRTCNEIIKYNLAPERRDFIHFILGFYSEELNNNAQAQVHYYAIVQRYPKSKFVGDAYRRMGENAFIRNDYLRAQAYFENAARTVAPEQASRVLHRLAWTYYRLRNVDRAVQTMKDAVSKATASGEKYLSVREEALRDLALFITEKAEVEESIQYFKNTAGDQKYFPRLLERLAKQYERNAEPEKAIRVYETLLKTSPDRELAIRVQIKLIDLELRNKHYKSALERIRILPPLSIDEEDTKITIRNLRAMVRKTATEHHELYRRNGARAALETAEQYYSIYLGKFLKEEDPHRETPEIQMYLAEVMKEKNEYQKATELYQKVMDSGDKRYTKESASLRVAALSDLLSKTPAPKTATELSPVEKQYVDAVDEFVELVPESSEAREASIRAAQLLAGYKSMQDLAIKRAKRMISKSPKSIQAITAARLWMQILSDRVVEQPKNSDTVEALLDAIRELESNTALMSTDRESGNGKFKVYLTDQGIRARANQISRQERAKDFSAAAAGYLKFALESRDQGISEKAFTSTVQALLKAKEYASCDEVYSKWGKRWGKTKVYFESLRSTATQLLIAGSFDESRKLFEKTGRETSDGSAVELAARIAEGSGDARTAQVIWQSLINSKMKDLNRGKLGLTLGLSYESAQQEPDALKAYYRCMEQKGETEFECTVRLADLHARAGTLNESRRLYRKIADRKPQTALQVMWIGYARFKVALSKEQEQQLVPLRLPENVLKEGIKQRMDFLEPLSRAYLSAVEAGGAWGVAALDRMASWVWQFADEVDKIEPEPEMTPTDVIILRKNLAAISAPLRSRAIQTWKEAWAKANADQIFSPMIPEIADRLSEKLGSEIHQAQGIRSRHIIMGVSPQGAQMGGRTQAFEKVREQLSRNPKNEVAWVDYGNLQLGDGRPKLAQIAYDRALALNARMVSAMNNKAVLILREGGMDDWIHVHEAVALFDLSLKIQGSSFEVLYNKAVLLNYYRLFKQSKPIWERLLLRASQPQVYDGLSIALQGTGNSFLSVKYAQKAQDAGMSPVRFARSYHDAVRTAGRGTDGAQGCLQEIEKLSSQRLEGFEKDSVERLERKCQAWKSQSR